MWARQWLSYCWVYSCFMVHYEHVLLGYPLETRIWASLLTHHSVPSVAHVWQVSTRIMHNWGSNLLRVQSAKGGTCLTLQLPQGFSAAACLKTLHPLGYLRQYILSVICFHVPFLCVSRHCDFPKLGWGQYSTFWVLCSEKCTKETQKPCCAQEQQIDALFMKIDWASQGSITWDEFCTYMQLEYAEKEDSYLRAKEVAFHTPARIENIPHRDPVLRITDTSDGTFVACSQVSGKLMT